MSQDNQFLKDVQKEVTSHVEKQKQLWAEEQEKAKELFEKLKQENYLLLDCQEIKVFFSPILSLSSGCKSLYYLFDL